MSPTECMALKQLKQESIKANPLPLPPGRCLRLPMIVHTTRGEVITK